MSCTGLSKFACSLHQPTHVTRIQRFFGLRIVDKRKCDPIDTKPKCVRSVRNGSDVKLYQIKNYFWYYLFSFGSKLGYELFYAFSFSYCYWNLDSFICRRLMLIWAVLMYVGQALKDIIKWPRPSGPNVLVLEPKYSMEYGMPSTHSMLSLLVPIQLFFDLYDRYEISVPIFFTVALIWCSLICCSRLYLGMHSILDILAGLTLTVILITPLLSMMDTIDIYLTQHWSSPIILISIIILLGLIYPKSNNQSPSRGDTCVMISGSGGVYIGSWLNYKLGIIRQVTLTLPFQINYPTSDELATIIIRTIIGLLVVVLFRFGGKHTIMAILKKSLHIDPNHMDNKHITLVEVPVKIFTYISVGFAIAFASPFVFHYLSIMRTSMIVEA